MGALVKWVNILTLSVFGNHSVEPEVPGQEEVDSPPEAAPVMEPEPPVVELKPELVAEAEAPISEPTEKAPASPTPADPAPAMPEENRVWYPPHYTCNATISMLFPKKHHISMQLHH